MANDRKKNRNLELLKNAVDSSREDGGAPRGGGAPGGGGGGGGNQIMYRGKPVGRSGGRGGSAPGAPGGGGRPPAQGGNDNEGGDVKEALRKLTQLFNDGLITTAEYDAKRAEILNRL